MKHIDNNHQFSIDMTRQERPLPYRVWTDEDFKAVLDETYPDNGVAVSGGWGYTKNQMTVIECNNEADGVAMEYKCVEYRTKQELIVFRPRGERFYDIHIKHVLQTLSEVDGRKCDMLLFEVDAIPESELLMGEDHRIDQSKRIRYKSIEYFDISKFYGKN